MDRLCVGVIGVGVQGQRHCRVVSGLRRAELVGVCDLNEELGGQVARQYEVPYYRDLDELLKHVDAVTLAAPTPFHYALALRCLERGIPLLVEKPMTETLAQAEALAAAAERSGLVMQVGHLERFNPAYTELKHVLEEVTPLAVEMRRLSPFERSNRDVDVILDLMIHDIDLVRDLAGGEPLLLNAWGLSASGPVDHALAHLQVAWGPLFSLTASRVTEQKVRSIQVTALEAYLECDLLNKQISVHRRTTGEYLDRDRRGVKYRQESTVERIQVPGSEPLALELEHFVSCVWRHEPPAVGVAAGLAAVRLAHAVRSRIEADLLDVRSNGRVAAERDALQRDPRYAVPASVPA
jgi:predicted dehydrogenase